MALSFSAVPWQISKNDLNSTTLAMPILNADYLAVAVKAFRSFIHVALQSENLEALIVFAMA